MASPQTIHKAFGNGNSLLAHFRLKLVEITGRYAMIAMRVRTEIYGTLCIEEHTIPISGESFFGADRQ